MSVMLLSCVNALKVIVWVYTLKITLKKHLLSLFQVSKRTTCINVFFLTKDFAFICLHLSHFPLLHLARFNNVSGFRFMQQQLVCLWPVTDASFGDTFICSIDIGISDTFSLIFWQYSIPILLLSDALINSVNNNTTLPKRVKARTVVLHLN